MYVYCTGILIVALLLVAIIFICKLTIVSGEGLAPIVSADSRLILVDGTVL